MSKPRFGIIFVLVCLATSITFAQSFFSKVSATGGQQGNQAMSPEAFSSYSAQQQQQVQANMTQQMNKSFAAAPFPVPGSSPAAATTQPQEQPQPVQQPAATDNSQDSSTDQSSGYQPAAPSNTGNGNKNSSSQQGLGIKY